MASALVDDQFDILGGFMAEIEGYLPVIAANIRQLLLTPDDEALLEESHRFAHTIKSSAAMMGMPELRRLAVPMEALLARSYAGEVVVDAAVVVAVDATLLRIRTCLTEQPTGSEMEALVKDNDRAYGALRPSAPDKHRAPSEDAQDRLVQSEQLPASSDVIEAATEESAAPYGDAPLGASGGDDSPVEAAPRRVDGDAWVAEVPLASAADDDRHSATPEAVPPVDKAGEAPAPWRPDVGDHEPAMPAERPRLTILSGRPGGDPTAKSDGERSIAAEWLAEILGPPPGEAAGTAAATSPRAIEPPPESAAADGAPMDIAALQHWEERLVAERAAFEARLERERRAAAALLESERHAHEDQQQDLQARHHRALREAEAAHERDLAEQREAMERDVQRYVEEELRPQLEDEIRQELTHEFEVAALLDPAPRVADAPRPAVAPGYSFAEDAALAAEMREIFAQEAADHIQAIGEHTLALRVAPNDPEHLHGLRRSVHTLKGAAGTVGLTAVSTLCHQIESALDHRLEGETAVDGPAQTLLLLESCDALEALVRGDAAATEQAHLLAERLSTLTGVPIPAPAAEPAPAETAPESADRATTLDLARLPAAPDRPIVGESEHQVDATTGAAAPTAGLAIRVSLTELDRLLAANHELIITESALELRLQRLQRTLGDVRHTGDRLRAAGGRLESGRSFALLLAGQPAVALPAPAVAGSGDLAAPTWRDVLQRRAETATADEFDSLELDRYTEFHRLTREVSEAALDVTTSDAEIGEVLDDLRLTLKQQQRLHALQNTVLLHARMVPLRVILPRLARAVQAVAAQQHKEVEFVVDGQETLLDRAVMEEVADALLHLVRNAVDHGMETPDRRLAAKKPAQGTIRLTARRVGPEIVLTLTDDGPGLDNAAILRSATARGLVSPAVSLSEHEVQQLIFSPGLSTAAAITDISGRGVGLDVVRANIHSLRGDVELASRPGLGTTFTLKVPISLALLTVALVEAAGNVYAIPLTLVRHVERVAARRIQKGDDGEQVQHGGRTYPVVDLATLLGLPAPEASATAPRSVVFVGASEGTVALAVDQLAGKREVVVKDLGRQLRSVRGLHGATALGNGDLALILDIPALLLQEVNVPARPVAAAPTVRRQRQLLVVDDSPSVRRLTCAVFERRGWQVRPARDGVEALELTQGWRPDAVVMDIEMPRMDGFELLAILRRQVDTAQVPTIMVTSRAGEKHREKAVRLGVDAYLVKPFREEELFGVVEDLLAQSSATVPA
jgi:chemotaxis protein histidine kinase CheA/ActR/RegA family two-component response regulator